MKIAATYKNKQRLQLFGHTEQFKAYKVDGGCKITTHSKVAHNSEVITATKISQGPTDSSALAV